MKLILFGFNTPALRFRSLSPQRQIHESKMPALAAWLLLSLIPITSCERKEKTPKPEVDTTATGENEESINQSLQAEREEAQRQKELQAEREEAQRRDEAQQEEARRQDQLQALQSKREEVRLQAKGEKIERLETLKGRVYGQVTIKVVSDIGLSILHESGSARIPFEDLPIELQERFMFDPDDKDVALLQEQRHQSAAHEAITAATSAEPVRSEQHINAERDKIMMALASKESRIQTLKSEISRIQDDIQTEEYKKISRSRGYYYDGYGTRRYYRHGAVGGISRAPIMREELSKKEHELATLERQVAMLRVKQESLSR